MAWNYLWWHRTETISFLCQGGAQQGAERLHLTSSMQAGETLGDELKNHLFIFNLFGSWLMIRGEGWLQALN